MQFLSGMIKRDFKKEKLRQPEKKKNTRYPLTGKRKILSWSQILDLTLIFHLYYFHQNK